MNIKINEFSSSLRKTFVCYLKLRQSMGRQCETEYRILRRLDVFLGKNNCTLTEESFNLWCKQNKHLKSGVRRNWMGIIRNFCLYHQRTEPNCFIPNLADFPPKHQSIQPYIFGEEEIIKLLELAIKLKPHVHSPIRAENCRLAIVLLYTIGLRVGELVRLTVGDYDPNQHTLLIRNSKFHKSRLIPLSEDGWHEIEKHLELRRQRRLPFSKDYALLWSKISKKKEGFCNQNAIDKVFCKLFQQAHIYNQHGKSPRVHDLRHSFAVHALRRWYREGVDVQTKLPMLSIYMGHVSIESTAYYLRFFKDTANLANERFEKCYGTFINHFNK